MPWEDPDRPKLPAAPEDLAAWLEAELKRDVGAAASPAVLSRLGESWGDQPERLRLEKVLRRHGVLIRVRKSLRPASAKRKVSPVSLADGIAGTDMGNGERFLAQHGESVLWCEPEKRWYLWDLQRWAVDQYGKIRELAKAEMRKIQDLADQTPAEERQALTNWVRRSESTVGSLAALQSASSVVSVIPDDLDADPWALNVQNGTLDLRTVTLRPHRREDRISKILPVGYDPDAKCPRWRRFVSEVTCGDKDLAVFLQMAVGYSLTGSTREQCFFLCWGEGANGKSTFLEAVQYALGDYGTTAGVAAFFDTRTDGLQPEVVRLRGSRFVSATETPKKARLDIEAIKRFTGSDRVTARTLHSEPISFEPQCKIWLATNDRPRINATDHGTWRRVRLIPWRAKFEGEDQDPDLLAKLKEEATGILAWAVDGCMAWLEDGHLPHPTAVDEATEEYREAEDVIGQWVEDCAEIVPNLEATGSDLYESYRTWAEKNGLRQSSNVWFAERLRARGLEKTRRRHGVVWRGIAVRGDSAQRVLT